MGPTLVSCSRPYETTLVGMQLQLLYTTVSELGDETIDIGVWFFVFVSFCLVEFLLLTCRFRIICRRNTTKHSFRRVTFLTEYRGGDCIVFSIYRFCEICYFAMTRVIGDRFGADPFIHFTHVLANGDYQNCRIKVFVVINDGISIRRLCTINLFMRWNVRIRYIFSINMFSIFMRLLSDFMFVVTSRFRKLFVRDGPRLYNK